MLSKSQEHIRKWGIIMSKKKTEKIGTINGIEILKKTRPIQDIPFRTGSFSDKRKKREKINKRNYDKWL